MKKILAFIAFASFFISINGANAAPQDIIINEIAWMGTAESADNEWLELLNKTSADIDLTGWILSAQDGAPVKTLSGTIKAGGFFILERTGDNTLPNIAADLIYTGALSNGGETLILKDQNGNEIDRIEASAGWSAGDNTTKQTMQRTADNGWITADPTPKAINSNQQPQQTTETSNEQQSSAENIISNSPISNPPVGGQAPNIVADAGDNIVALLGQEIILNASKSQGASSYEWNFGDGSTSKEKIAKHKYNFTGKYIITLFISNGESESRDQITASVYPSGVYIGEFLPSPAGSDDDEWIEIYNSNNFPVDLSGWKLDDKENKTKPFIIPQNTFIAAKNYLVFSRMATKIALNNNKDSIRFYYPENIVIDEIKYEESKEDYSAARRQDGNFIWTKNITPGAPNIFLSESASYQNSAKQDGASSVDLSPIKSANLISRTSKYAMVNAGNFSVKNFISSANAQTVAEEQPAQNGENAGDSKQALENKNNSGNISASINESIKNISSKNMISRIILTLFTLAIFAMIWQAMKKK